MSKPISCLLANMFLLFCTSVKAQDIAATYRESAQRCREAAAKAPTRASCYNAYATYYDCLASQLVNGSNATCPKPSCDMSSPSDNGGASANYQGNSPSGQNGGTNELGNMVGAIGGYANAMSRAKTSQDETNALVGYESALHPEAAGLLSGVGALMNLIDSNKQRKADQAAEQQAREQAQREAREARQAREAEIARLNPESPAPSHEFGGDNNLGTTPVVDNVAEAASSHTFGGSAREQTRAISSFDDASVGASSHTFGSAPELEPVSPQAAASHLFGSAPTATPPPVQEEDPAAISAPITPTSDYSASALTSGGKELAEVYEMHGTATVGQGLEHLNNFAQVVNTAKAVRDGDIVGTTAGILINPLIYPGATGATVGANVSTAERLGKDGVALGEYSLGAATSNGAISSEQVGKAVDNYGREVLSAGVRSLPGVQMLANRYEAIDKKIDAIANNPTLQSAYQTAKSAYNKTSDFIHDHVLLKMTMTEAESAKYFGRVYVPNE